MLQEAIVTEESRTARQQEQPADGTPLGEGPLDQVAADMADGHVVGSVRTAAVTRYAAIDRHVERSYVVALHCSGAEVNVSPCIHLDCRSAKMTTWSCESPSSIDAQCIVVQVFSSVSVNEYQNG